MGTEEKIETVVYDHHDEKDEAPKGPSSPAQTDEAALLDSRSISVIRSNRAGLAANIILLIGFTFALWFGIYEFNGRDRETIAIVVYFLAFAFLIISGLVELSVDVFSVRTTGHGRYHSDSAVWNSFISCLFVLAGMLDIVAFVYWMRRDPDTEVQVLLVSSYVLLTMAILALYFQLRETKEQQWQIITSDKIDLVSNGLVFIISVAGVVLRHMQYPGNDFGDVTDELELALMPIFLFSSILYVTTDVMRL